MGAEQTTVVIVNWNGAAFLPRLVTSIEREIVSKIIVVDNNSTDHSLEILQQASGVRLITNKENKGYGMAANQAFEECDTPYLLLLNVDVEAQPGSIGTLQQFLERNPEAGIVAPQLVFPNGQLQRSIRSFPTPARLAAYLSFLDRVFPSAYRKGIADHQHTHEIDQPMGAALLIRKSALTEVGPFDPQFFLYMEEVDLCLRFKQNGWKIFYLPEAKMIHHAGGSSVQDWERSQRNFLDSSMKYFRKHFPQQRSELWLAPALIIRSLVLFLSGQFRKSRFFFLESLRLGGSN